MKTGRVLEKALLSNVDKLISCNSPFRSNGTKCFCVHRPPKNARHLAFNYLEVCLFIYNLAWQNKNLVNIWRWIKSIWSNCINVKKSCGGLKRLKPRNYDFLSRRMELICTKLQFPTLQLSLLISRSIGIPNWSRSYHFSKGEYIYFFWFQCPINISDEVSE